MQSLTALQKFAQANPSLVSLVLTHVPRQYAIGLIGNVVLFGLIRVGFTPIFERYLLKYTPNIQNFAALLDKYYIDRKKRRRYETILDMLGGPLTAQLVALPQEVKDDHFRYGLEIRNSVCALFPTLLKITMQTVTGIFASDFAACLFIDKVIRPKCLPEHVSAFHLWALRRSFTVHWMDILMPWGNKKYFITPAPRLPVLQVIQIQGSITDPKLATLLHMTTIAGEEYTACRMNAPPYYRHLTPVRIFVRYWWILLLSRFFGNRKENA
eukprot:PhF_6_TR27391/c0_g1_i1/m.40309